MGVAPVAAALAGLTASAAVVLSVALVLGDPAATPSIGSFVPAATASPGPVTSADPDPAPSPAPVTSAPVAASAPATGPATGRSATGPVATGHGHPQPDGPGSTGGPTDPPDRLEPEASPTPSRELPDD